MAVYSTYYRGQFLCLAGHRWLVNICNPHGYPAGQSQNFPGELTFAADTAELEWKDTEKTDVLIGSSLTLTVESPGDRTYTHLYTVETGHIFVRLFRDNKLYWQGQIDPEQYEEPYSSASRYDVDLTFSDFGLMDRLEWEKPAGFMTLREVLDECLRRVGLDDVPVEESLGISPGFNYHPESLTLSDFKVNLENFFDENGAAMTLREVLEAVLKPLGVRVKQKDGKISVTTLQALYAAKNASQIRWEGTDSMLGVDKVYNKVTLTASRYVPTKLAGFDMGELLESYRGTGSLWMTQDHTDDKSIAGFYLKSAKGDTAALDKVKSAMGDTVELGPQTYPARMTSVFSGDDDVMFVWCARSEKTRNEPYNEFSYYTSFWSGANNNFYGNPNGGTAVKLLTLRSGYVNAGVNPWGDEVLYQHRYRTLRVRLEALFDVRYNPFEEACEDKDYRSVKDISEKDEVETFAKWLNFAYIHCDLVVKDDKGKILAWYENADAILADWPGYEDPDKRARKISTKNYNVRGRWYRVSEKPFMAGRYWLSYYDWSDRQNNCAFDGWTANKRTLGAYRKSLPDSWQKMGDGDFIYQPPVGGWLEMTVYPDLYTNADPYPYGSPNGATGYDYARWFMLKVPEISIVTPNGSEPGEDMTGDIVISAWLNKAAADELEIDTRYYTAREHDYESPQIIGRAAILDANGEAFTTYQTIGQTQGTATAELHLIGNIFSQYATPHTVLSGTIAPFDSPLLTDRATEGLFLPQGEIYNIRMGEVEVRAVELSQETYEGIEFE